jgi:hypothetical protein
VIVQIGKRLVRQRTIEASNEALCHPARRMKDLLELGDLRRGILRAVFDFEKREVFLRNEPELEQAQLPFWGCFHVNANSAKRQSNPREFRAYGEWAANNVLRFE